MSDYMFMLESHLSNQQNQVVAEVEATGARSGAHVFLSGGTMRDMLGGYPIRDLDFTIEGDAAKVVKALVRDAGAEILSIDETRKTTELRFPNGVLAEIRLAHTARYPRPGAKPVIQPASIHEDLQQRDFSINSIALSLSPGSRGLLRDPANGLADLERRELRANSSYSLYDDPVRILRMFRLQVRMGLTLDPRLQSQYQNVREAGLESKIPPRDLLHELHRMATEPNLVLLLETLARENLLVLFSPALQGPRLNLAGFAKLEKARQLIPFGAGLEVAPFGLFCYTLTEKLSPKERLAMSAHLGMSAADIDSWQKLEARARKLETTLKAPRLNRASLVYRALRQEPGELILFLLIRSSHRLVTDRIRNFLQKYLPMAAEISDRDLAHLALDPTSSAFAQARDELICATLDGRVRKPAPAEAADEAASTAPASSRRS
jgi:tRNA nucleotidyltransferase/poly(A) polymerase